jgi:hypothetical protein
MADNTQPMMVQDSDVSKFEKISFSFTLQLHLSRMSALKSSITTAGNIDEKTFTMHEQIELLEDFLCGYFDGQYKAETAEFENYTKDPMEFDLSADSTSLLIIDKIAAMKYLRKKLQAIMRLMARKNLLLQEDAVGEI